jgi:hypothetical protein
VLEGAPWPWTDVLPGLGACVLLGALALAYVSRVLARAALR